MPATHLLAPGQSVDLGSMPSRATPFHQDRAAAKGEFKALRRELRDWQARLYAHGQHRLLIVLQAMDAGGKDGTIRNVFQGVNPQGVRVTSFKVPSKEELAHDFLWRVHQKVPASGMIAVFNRSHYEDVLVVRVHGLAPESAWRPRYEQINAFEKMLAESGTILLKFYLHISKEEQARRFQARLDDPRKQWKFSLEDLEKRKLWPAYMAAFEEALARCSTAWAPWYIIPADQKWYRNLAVTRVIVDSLRRLDPRYPLPDMDLSGIKVV